MDGNFGLADLRNAKLEGCSIDAGSLDHADLRSASLSDEFMASLTTNGSVTGWKKAAWSPEVAERLGLTTAENVRNMREIEEMRRKYRRV